MADEKKDEKKEEKKPDEIIRTEQVKVPTTGQFTVSLLQVNNKRYPNYRKTLREEHAKELFTSIKAEGQLQACAGSWSPDGSVIELWGGFSRFEVMQRIALEKVVREYNDTMKKQAGDEGFIPLGGSGFASQTAREKIREAGPEWKLKYDAALASYKIKFDVSPVENDDDAAMKGVATNLYDKPPLADYCEQIEALCSREGVTAGRVGKVMGIVDSHISQYRKINRMPGLLRDMFEKADYAKDLGITDQEKAKREKEILLMAVGEFVRRMNLPNGDSEAIKFSLAREVAGVIDNKKEPIAVAAAARIVKLMVRVNQAGNLSGLPTPEWDDFKIQVADAKKVGKLEAEGGAAATGTPAATPPAVTLQTLTADQQAVIDKAAAATAPGAAPTAAAGTPTVVSPNAPPAVALSAEEQAKQDALKAANVGDAGTTGADGGAAEDIDLDDLVPTADALNALATAGEEGAAPLTPATPVGQLASKPKDAPADSRYRLKAPEKIEKVARDLVAEAGNGSENVTLVDQSAYVFGAVQLFDSLGMDKESEECNEVYANFTEGLVAYITAMEEFIKSAQVSDAVKAPILAQRPLWVQPLAAKPAAAAA